MRFKDWDDEDSYQMLRKRERKQGFVSNYGDRYFSTTEFGDIVIEQRALMVQWIVEVGLSKTNSNSLYYYIILYYILCCYSCRLINFTCI